MPSSVTAIISVMIIIFYCFVDTTVGEIHLCSVEFSRVGRLEDVAGSELLTAY